MNNILDNTKPCNIGLGSKMEKLKFTSNLDSTNHIATDKETNIIEVDIDTLDNVLASQSQGSPIMLKIDVEGFETEVLNGAAKILEDANLKVIIIELIGSGMRYGFDESKIEQNLIEKGFKAYKYNPLTRELILFSESSKKELNTIYIRDIDFVNNRIQTARKIKIHDSII